MKKDVKWLNLEALHRNQKYDIVKNTSFFQKYVILKNS